MTIIIKKVAKVMISHAASFYIHKNGISKIHTAILYIEKYIYNILKNVVSIHNTKKYDIIISVHKKKKQSP